MSGEAVEVRVGDWVGDDVFDVADGPALSGEDEATSGFVAIAPGVVVELIVEGDGLIFYQLECEDGSKHDGVGGVVKELIDVVGGERDQVREASLDTDRAASRFESGFVLGDAPVDAVPRITEGELGTSLKQQKLRTSVAMAKDIGIDDVGCDRSH